MTYLTPVAQQPHTERTLEDIQYDLHVTVGRAGGEDHVFEIGYWLGILAPYLDEGFAIDEEYEVRRNDWFHEDSFTGAREEGAGNRYEHTAEDLYLWAHDWMAGRTWPGGSQ